MQAIIDASGEGTRLRPLTCTRAAALLPIGGESVIERMIRTLSGFKVTVILGYLAGDVERALKKWGNVTFIRSDSEPDTPLGLCREIAEENFFYFSCPVYTECDLEKMMEFHTVRGSDATSLLRSGEEGRRIIADHTGKISRIEEKRLWSPSSPASCGVYILNKSVFSNIPSFSPVDLDESLMPSLVRGGANVYSYVTDKPTEEICDIPSYRRAWLAYLEGHGGVIKEEGASVEAGAMLEAPCYIGKNAKIKKGALIGACSAVGEGTVVSASASVKRSVILDSCRISRGASLRGCVVDGRANIGKNAAIYEQAVIGSGCAVGQGATVRSFVRIWPEKEVGENLTVSENIMWGEQKREKLFEDGEISGVINSSITPELCLRLGQAMGTLTASGEIGISCDGAASSEMLRDAISAGALSSGAAVRDFGEQPLAITRRAAAFYFLQGSAAISAYTKDGEEYARVTVLGRGGIDLSGEEKRRLEDIYQKGDFLRADSESVREREYFFEYKLYYLKNLVEGAKTRHAGFRLLLSCRARWGRRLFASAAADLGSEVRIYSAESDDENDFASAVAAGGFDMGYMIDERCEALKIALPDGEIIEGDTYDALTALVLMKKYRNAKIILPVTSSSAAEKAAKKYGAEIIYTKSAKSAVMSALSGGGELEAEEYIYRFDAVGAAIKLTDFCAERKTTLKALSGELPKTSVARRSAQAADPRRALERVRSLKGSEVPSPEGVKITFDKGWVVVVPEGEKNLRVVGESISIEAAEELCDMAIAEIIKP